LPGKPGETRRIRVELKLMADIGLVGLPNAGKSSLLERFTNARPKIAAYPFTTRIPNLGVLSYGYSKGDRDGTGAGRDILIADIPGIIEGASHGAGLGLEFLKHISRTQALLFLIDLSDEAWNKAYDTLFREISSYSSELATKKRMIIGTKLDLLSEEDGSLGRLEELQRQNPDDKVLGISVFSGQGLPELAQAIVEMCSNAAGGEGRE
jgi:GTP-binding protein